MSNYLKTLLLALLCISIAQTRAQSLRSLGVEIGIFKSGPKNSRNISGICCLPAGARLSVFEALMVTTEGVIELAAELKA